jgi:hypothetical protein
MCVPRDLSPHYDPQNGKLPGKKRDTFPERFSQLFHFGIISFGRQGDSRRFL